MLNRFYKITFFITITFLITSCANRGTPTGGEKDIIPPVITKSSPENFTTNFTGNEIRIYFDEYIKVKDIRKQLIISPPMDPEPDIIPLGSASKYISIKINDTLDANTTYAFNFGQSIVDNNEENPYPYFRYVFSTGDYIDSLSVKGVILDAKNRVPDKFVSIMLYPIDSTYTDSIIYKKKPKYITNTLDSVTTFSIDNIKAGRYKLIALKEENSNFTFQQKTDKIGFYDTVITVPSDSLYVIKLFKEETNFKALRPKQVAGHKIAFGYEGNAKDIEIEMLSQKPKDFKNRITKDKKTDTLYYWYKPKLKLDSTLFIVRNKTFVDTLKLKFSNKEKDSLIISANPSGGTLKFTDDFKIEGNIPFTSIDEKLITILDKDSIVVPFKTAFKNLENRYTFDFEKKESETYKIRILPNALTDFFGNTNDTLNYSLKTKEYSTYGDMRFVLKNAKYPIIVQLIDEKGDVQYEQYVAEPKPIDFRYLTPKTYYLRLIFDSNKNKKWDSGNYLKKIQPERISYFPESIEVRANSDRIYEFTLLN
jgi:hypothetical protein